MVAGENPVLNSSEFDGNESKQNHDARLTGTVISHLGKSLAVEAPDHQIIACHTLRRLGTAAVGDQVLWEKLGCDQGRVLKILPRVSVLTRPTHNGRSRPVAANLTRLLIVFAPKPRCDFLLVDQFLAICEYRGIAPILLFNKIDLPQDEERKSLEHHLSVYEQLGYALFRVSAKQQSGLDLLREALAGHTNMLVGQSGVGKSSLTNTLLPDKNVRIGALSQASQHGKHTTTAATLFHLPGGGHLIDSPGVAVFGLDKLSEQDLAYGYREFHRYLPECHFNDCRHMDDKGCAIVDALNQDKINRQRYNRFVKLLGRLPRAQ